MFRKLMSINLNGHTQYAYRVLIWHITIDVVNKTKKVDWYKIRLAWDHTIMWNLRELVRVTLDDMIFLPGRTLLHRTRMVISRRYREEYNAYMEEMSSIRC